MLYLASRAWSDDEYMPDAIAVIPASSEFAAWLAARLAFVRDAARAVGLTRASFTPPSGSLAIYATPDHMKFGESFAIVEADDPARFGEPLAVDDDRCALIVILRPGISAAFLEGVLEADEVSVAFTAGDLDEDLIESLLAARPASIRTAEDS